MALFMISPSLTIRNVDKALLLSLCLFFNISITPAQNRSVDSLSLELHKSRSGKLPDTVLINLYIELSYQYHKINPDTGIMYADTALALSESTHWKKGIASAKNRYGLCLWAKGEYPQSLKFNYDALTIAEQTGDRPLIATIYGNLGLTFGDQQNYPKALESHFKALRMNEALQDSGKIALNLGNIGIIYDAQGNFEGALDYYTRSLKLYELLGIKSGIARNLGNIGYVYQELHKSQQALKAYFKALEMNRKLGNTILTAINLGNIGEVYYNIAANREDNVDGLPKFTSIEKSRQYLSEGISMFETIGDYNSLSELYHYLSDLEVLAGNYKAGLNAYVRFAAANDSVKNEENAKESVRTLMQYEFNKKQALEHAEQAKKDAVARQQLANQRNIRNFSFAGLAGLLCFTVIVIRQRNKVSAGKARSDELLLNILPEETAEELKATGEAQAKDFKSVTVLFTDFKNFTQLSSKLSAQELVNEINFCYSAFDKIVMQYGIEKIKTIGDSYMCAGGLPVANHTNAEDTIRAAIEIRDFMLKEKEKREAVNKPFFEIRIGCNTGPVVAGIVGIRKFAYDIWGNTVNIASRMESCSEPGKINISGSTYEVVKDKFRCTYRGKIEAKNAGMIDMYFVE